MTDFSQGTGKKPYNGGLPVMVARRQARYKTQTAVSRTRAVRIMSQPAIAKARGRTVNGRAKINRSLIFSGLLKMFVEIVRPPPGSQCSCRLQILWQMISRSRETSGFRMMGGSGQVPFLLAEQRRGWSLMIFCAHATRGFRRMRGDRQPSFLLAEPPR